VSGREDPASAERADLIARVERAEVSLRRYAVRQGALDFFSIDLTVQQLRVLFVLMASGALSAHELAETLRIGPTTLTGIVDRLQARDLVHRLADERDRRVRRIDLTEAGRRLLNDLNQLKRDHERRLLARLDLAKLAGLAEAVEALAQACQELDREDGDLAHHPDGAPSFRQAGATFHS
jgi:DNA-binding MarR family transcriptional regulator